MQYPYKLGHEDHMLSGVTYERVSLFNSEFYKFFRSTLWLNFEYIGSSPIQVGNLIKLINLI